MGRYFDRSGSQGRSGRNWVFEEEDEMSTESIERATDALFVAIAVIALLATLPACRELGAPEGADEDLVAPDEGQPTGNQGYPSGLHCMAPDRDEYKAAHGIAPEGEEDETFFAADSFAIDMDAPLETDSMSSYDGMEHTILFVFDKSGSMDGSWGQRTKWAVARDAMIGSVSLFEHYLSAGAIFFPTDFDCEVAPIASTSQIGIQDGGGFLTEWEELMYQYQASGATPLERALEQAHMAITLACWGGILERPFKVVLLTDGEPNCEWDNDFNSMTRYPRVWLRHGIETHVIGLPGSEPAESLLWAIAEAGGTELFIAPQTDDPDDSTEDFEDEMDVVCE